MNKLQSGNTVLGILLGMLGGILITSALAWFIFKSPAPYVPKEQVVASKLTLPAGVVEELMAMQRRTGNPNATLTSSGYRLRTNSQHEIFVTPLTASGVAVQPEVQVRHTGTSGGNGKPRFDFYEMLSKRHYPGENELQPVVQNQGKANITIYDAPPGGRLPVAKPMPSVKPASGVTAVGKLPASAVGVHSHAAVSGVPPRKPFVSTAASQVVIAPVNGKRLPAANDKPAAQPVADKPAKSTPVAEKPVKATSSAPADSKLTYLEVDFFPSFGDAAKLQEKLLAKGIEVQLKEQKVRGKHAGYTVLSGPYLDSKHLGEAKAKLKKMGLNPTEHE